jgi:uncharacterized membrane protein YtjA (UPF0391 family)
MSSAGWHCVFPPVQAPCRSCCSGQPGTPVIDRCAQALRLWRQWALQQEEIMLYYAVVFFVIALIAAVFGFGGIAASAAGIAQVLFFVFLFLAVVGLVVSLFRKS